MHTRPLSTAVSVRTPSPLICCSLNRLQPENMSLPHSAARPNPHVGTHPVPPHPSLPSLHDLTSPPKGVTSEVSYQCTPPRPFQSLRRLVYAASGCAAGCWAAGRWTLHPHPPCTRRCLGVAPCAACARATRPQCCIRAQLVSQALDGLQNCPGREERDTVERACAAACAPAAAALPLHTLESALFPAGRLLQRALHSVMCRREPSAPQSLGWRSPSASFTPSLTLDSPLGSSAAAPAHETNVTVSHGGKRHLAVPSHVCVPRSPGCNPACARADGRATMPCPARTRARRMGPARHL